MTVGILIFFFISLFIITAACLFKSSWVEPSLGVAAALRRNLLQWYEIGQDSTYLRVARKIQNQKGLDLFIIILAPFSGDCRISGSEITAQKQ